MDALLPNLRQSRARQPNAFSGDCIDVTGSPTQKPASAPPTNLLLKGAWLGSCSTFSAFTPHFGHRARYSSSTTVVEYSKQALSRISRSYTTQISLTRHPQPEHTTLRLPGLRRTHNFSALAPSSISARKTG